MGRRLFLLSCEDDAGCAVVMVLGDEERDDGRVEKRFLVGGGAKRLGEDDRELDLVLFDVFLFVVFLFVALLFVAFLFVAFLFVALLFIVELFVAFLIPPLLVIEDECAGE